MRFSTLVVETGLKAFAELYNFISCKEQQREEGERVRKNERECVREREKRVENERIQKLEKRVFEERGRILNLLQKFSPTNLKFAPLGFGYKTITYLHQFSSKSEM